MTSIGTLHSCFKEKFGIPRQPGLANTARAELRLENEFATMDAVRGLEQCSHIWVLFLFSEHLDRGWTPLVRPPRSGGGKLGVFATRATFRPNPIGMSVVKLERIENRNGQPVLHLSGVDILDGTPVLDIKPYLPYADRLDEADYPYAPDGQKTALSVVFSEQAQQRLSKDSAAAQLQQLIIDVLSCDPRPTHRRKRDDERVYGTLLEHYNVRWQIQQDRIDVLAIDPATDNTD
ncbi:tRNA (N6-threonylcarbamoyladenosine(37)-N6)-methyltransferase TrmO [Motiliproteus coralliicola]|uniref:tRNA (N6-threonylcarbamoyladenosine(37)-N6)-methyltransferase TrmO n=2 Tax=Motiliproteus coralliicola TaxID=2283196 RepID=A0A369WUP5_9GAMM|nr:tRNA (N6-threonylcarbamoyladenosine(37)-N6)-methyltransferase TrmO [Motiliproteus coralliicola]